MRDDYTVKELASLCNVTEQAIRYYLAQNDCAKIANKWKPTQDELAALFSHYGVDIATLAQETQDFAQTTQDFAQKTQDEETAGQAAIFKAQVEQLEIRLQEQKEATNKTIETQENEIKFLRQQILTLTEKNERLLAENDGIKNQLLLAATSRVDEATQEQVETINIDDVIQEQENNNIEPETVQEKEEIKSSAVEPVNISTLLKDLSIWDFFRLRREGRNG